MVVYTLMDTMIQKHWINLKTNKQDFSSVYCLLLCTRLLSTIPPLAPQVAAFTRSRGSLASHRRRARGTKRRAAAAPTASWDTAGELTDGGKAETPRFHRTPAVPTPTNGLTAGRWEWWEERGRGFGCVMHRIEKNDTRNT